MPDFPYSTEHLNDIHWSRLVAFAWLDAMAHPDDKNNFLNRLERDPRKAVDYAIKHYPEFANLKPFAKKVFHVDGPPSPLDDYTADLINEIRNGETALYFPVGTCC